MICPITQEEIRIKQKLACGHVFEKEALDEWLKNGTKTCPMCRKEAKTQLEAMNEMNIKRLESYKKLRGKCEIISKDLSDAKIGDYIKLSKNDEFYKILGETKTQWRVETFDRQIFMTIYHDLPYGQWYTTYYKNILCIPKQSRNISKKSYGSIIKYNNEILTEEETYPN